MSKILLTSDHSSAFAVRRLLGSGVRRPRLETVACVGYRLTAPVP